GLPSVGDEDLRIGMRAVDERPRVEQLTQTAIRRGREEDEVRLPFWNRFGEEARVVAVGDDHQLRFRGRMQSGELPREELRRDDDAGEGTRIERAHLIRPEQL